MLVLEPPGECAQWYHKIISRYCIAQWFFYPKGPCDPPLVPLCSTTRNDFLSGSVVVFVHKCTSTVATHLKSKLLLQISWLTKLWYIKAIHCEIELANGKKKNHRPLLSSKLTIHAAHLIISQIYMMIDDLLFVEYLMMLTTVDLPTASFVSPLSLVGLVKCF